MATKEQLAVPASMAEQLDPPIETVKSEIQEHQLVANPSTRGVQRGADLRADLEAADKADEKAAEASHKAAAKSIGADDDLSKTTTGEVVPKEVQKADEEAQKLLEERKKETEAKSPPKEGEK